MSERFNTARVDDGWRYVLWLAGGAHLEVWDHDGYEAVAARWREARDKGEPFLFSGAAPDANMPPEAGGAIDARAVLAIREYSTFVDDEGRDAFFSSHAAAKDLETAVLREKLGLPEESDEQPPESEPEAKATSIADLR